ncbi:Asp-tRNA(Asn)/Glu-tRNA(Gln) amidotransferase subunit GatC [Marinicella sp. W31]|uniref:Asp-tRNA(Asn)/Glu-tRNA(Gln) amidotransferase subunit GatC n=1 Tax=Marinicella sp. W31 TaxID=3023713 RepID=UPI003756CE8C
MLINHQQIAEIAKLAQLYISDQEMESVAESVNQVVQLIEEINRFAVDEVEPMCHPFDMLQPLREDRAIEHNNHDALLALSSNSDSHYYLVPKVIE